MNDPGPLDIEELWCPNDQALNSSLEDWSAIFPRNVCHKVTPTTYIFLILKLHNLTKRTSQRFASKLNASEKCIDARNLVLYFCIYWCKDGSMILFAWSGAFFKTFEYMRQLDFFLAARSCADCLKKYIFLDSYSQRF